jgi:hypothetical protein
LTNAPANIPADTLTVHDRGFDVASFGRYVADGVIE